MEDGEEEEGKGPVMWFCVGQDYPPPDEEFVGGGGFFGPSKKPWDAGGGARGRRLSLARLTATTTLAEARADCWNPKGWVRT